MIKVVHESKCDPNYEITVINGKYTIDNSNLSVTVDPYKAEYDGKPHRAGTITVKTGKLLTYAKVYYGESAALANQAALDNNPEAAKVPEYTGAGNYDVYYCITCENYNTVEEKRQVQKDRQSGQSGKYKEIRHKTPSFYCSTPFIVREMRFFLTSTDRTFTLTTSPTDTASSGCLMKRSVNWEMCTRPS